MHDIVHVKILVCYYRYFSSKHWMLIY